MKIKDFIGDFGRYQAWVFIVISLPFLVMGGQVVAFNFTGAVPETRCFLPGIDNITSPTFELNSTLWSIFAKPTLERGKEQRCKYCPDAIENYSSLEGNVSCTKDKAVECAHGYVYSTDQYHSTLAMKFDLVCSNKWKRQVASSCFMLGYLIGAFVAGNLSDRFGRRPVILAFALLGTLFDHLMIFVPNYVLFCLNQIVVGALCYGAFVTAFVLAMEITDGLPRTVVGIMVTTIFSAGLCYAGLCAYFLRDYKWLQFAVSAPSLLYLGYYWLVPESIRWLIVNGRSTEAKDLILKGARINKIHVIEEDLDKTVNFYVVAESELKKSTKRSTVLDLFRHRSLAKITLIICFTWFAVGMSYYGLLLNTNDLPGNDYVNFEIGSVVEFLVHFLCIPMVEKWGRRPSQVSTLGIGGVAVIISVALPRRLGWLIVTLGMIGRAGAACAFAVVYNYSAELFPTVVRNAGVGTASVCARIATISAPLVYLLGSLGHPWIPFVIYGCVAIAAALLDLLLPETLNKVFPDTIEDGIALSMSKSPEVKPWLDWKKLSSCKLR